MQVAYARYLAGERGEDPALSKVFGGSVAPSPAPFGGSVMDADPPKAGDPKIGGVVDAARTGLGLGLGLVPGLLLGGALAGGALALWARWRGRPRAT
jgi:hypothetical protein